MDNPVAPNEIANKDYVDGKLGETAQSFAAPVFVTNVTNGGDGIVGNKSYLNGTVPANVVVTEATSDDDSVTIHVMAEGGRFYSPTLTISGTPSLPDNEGQSITLTPDVNDIRTFHGQLTLTGITEDTDITVSSDTGADAVVRIVRATGGPSLVSVEIGGYPGTQTAARENQIMTLSGVVDNDATAIEILNVGAAKANSSASVSFGANDSDSFGFKTFTTQFTVSNRTGTQSVQLKALNNLGTGGNVQQSTNSVILDQLSPSINSIVITYPDDQEAIKGTEQATIAFDLINTTRSDYTFGSSLSLVSGNLDGSELLVVEGTGSGDKIAGHNVTIVARRPENDTITSVNVLVKTTNTPHSNAISIVGNPARLISSPTGEAYSVVITSDAELDPDIPPTITVPSGSISAMTRISDNQWSAILTIDDNSNRGTFDFANIKTVGISGIEAIGASNTEYVVGGFTIRTLTIPLFDSTPGNEIVGRTTDMGVLVTDPTKLEVLLTGVLMSYVATVDDTPLSFTVVDSHQGFTDPYVQVANHSPTGRILYLNDRDQAGANTTGTMTLTVREVE